MGRPCDVPVHGVFEQDRPNDPLAGEAGTGDDARTHMMHEIKHLIVVCPGMLLDSVKCQRVRGAAAALIERRDEPGMSLHFLKLFLVRDASCHDASLNSGPLPHSIARLEVSTRVRFFWGGPGAIW